MKSWGAPAKGWPSFDEDGSLLSETIFSKAAGLLRDRGRCVNQYEDGKGGVDLIGALRIACHGDSDFHPEPAASCLDAEHALSKLVDGEVVKYADNPATADGDVLDLLARAHASS